MYGQMFARVDHEPQILRITVINERASDGEFSRLIESAEEAYRSRGHPFVLLLDLTRMNQIPLPQAMAWIDLFHRVMPITRERLICTCLCFRDDLVRAAVQLFLALYNPVKPFFIHATVEECDECASRNIQAMTVPRRQE